MKTLALETHGGNLKEFAKRFALNENQIIDFSSNVNPLPFSEEARAIYQDAFKRIQEYPDPEASELREAISEYLGVPPGTILPGNGSMAHLSLLLQYFRPRSLVLAEPGFSEYRKVASALDVEIETVFLPENKNFEPSLNSLLEALTHRDGILLGNPNNPTGTLLSPTEMLELIQYAQSLNKLVILDEAFVDWLPESSLVQKVESFENLVVLRSLTKFFGLAGLRVGYTVANSGLIHKLNEIQGPWACNLLAQKLGTYLLQNRTFQDQSRNWLQQERTWLLKNLSELNTFKIYPGSVNFILLQCQDGSTADNWYELLGHQGFYLRRAADFQGLNDQYLRTAVKTRTENEKLMNALRAGI